jgi:putative transposase
MSDYEYNELDKNRDHHMEKDFYIVFIDEAGFMLEPLARKTWARRGHTPVIQIADNPHNRLSVIGAMAIKMVKPRQFSFLFHLSQDNTNFHGHSIVPFLDNMYKTLSGRINLVWDSIKIHTAEPVNIFFALHPAIKVFFFPPYAPELNPVDNIWGYIKYNCLANFCPHNLTELRKHVRAELFRIQKRPDLLESMFRHTGLNYE